MRRTRRGIVIAGLVLCGVAASCTDDGPTRVAFEDLIDPDAPIPEGATGVDLGDEFDALVPSLEFCDVAGSVPLRWFGDAVASTQVAVDAFGAATDVPAEAQEPIERLVNFGEQYLRWQLGTDPDRPELNEQLRGDVVTVAAAAFAHCADLPLVIGLPPDVSPPDGWSELSDEERADHCVDIREDFERSVAAYQDLVGEPPRHSIMLDARLPYSAMDWFGLVDDPVDGPQIVAVPGAGCDYSTVAG